MGRNYKWQTTEEKIAVGIQGDRHSLCGAIKRFELNGTQWNGLLTLKELCARHIALIKNGQIKCFILGYLTSDLFQYVNKDIFNLQRQEFISNYPKPLYMCQECTMDSYEKPCDDCQCPQMYNAINVLNNHLFKQMNHVDETIEEEEDDDDDDPKALKLIYKIPNDGMDHSYELKQPTSFFLYLSPMQYTGEINECSMNEGPFHQSKILKGQISAENKLLFVDVMRFFGGFKTIHQEPELIFYRRREFSL